jgi:hypothetical protein
MYFLKWKVLLGNLRITNMEIIHIWEEIKEKKEEREVIVT